MRDEKRIDVILDELKVAWKKVPDQRFCQLLINMGIMADSAYYWNLEDTDIENGLKAYNSGKGVEILYL